MTQQTGNGRRPSRLGASVAGFPAFALDRLLKEYGPKHLTALERSVELGKLSPELLNETRETWADINEAAAWWINSQGPRSAKSAGGPLSIGATDSAALSMEITTEQAAEMLHVGAHQVSRLIRAGHLTGRKVNRTWLVVRHSVETYRRERQ